MDSLWLRNSFDEGQFKEICPKKSSNFASDKELVGQVLDNQQCPLSFLEIFATNLVFSMGRTILVLAHTWKQRAHKAGS